VSAKDDDVFAVIENNDEYLLFLTHVCKYLNEIDPPISPKNIKQLSNTLNKVIIDTVKYNLAQVLSQFREIHKKPCKYCNSSEYFDN
jgi:hypothetical protein